MDPGGGKGHAVIGADSVGQAVVPEELLKDRAHALPSSRQQAVTGEEVASVLVSNRERIAVDPVAGAKVTFKVGRPEIIRLSGGSRDHSRMLVTAATAPLFHQAAARQEIAR